jgi:hypothetical protein
MWSLPSLFQSCKAVYDRIIDLKIATPQIIINYSLFLEEHKYFEEAFRVSLFTDIINNACILLGVFMKSSAFIVLLLLHSFIEQFLMHLQ